MKKIIVLIYVLIAQLCLLQSLQGQGVDPYNNDFCKPNRIYVEADDCNVNCRIFTLVDADAVEKPSETGRFNPPKIRIEDRGHRPPDAIACAVT